MTIYGMMDQRTVMDDDTTGVGGALSLDKRLANVLLRFLWTVHEGGKKIEMFPADFDASLARAQAQLQVADDSPCRAGRVGRSVCGREGEVGLGVGVNIKVG